MASSAAIVCTFSCDILTEEDFEYIGKTLGMGDLEINVYKKYMSYWKGGKECDNGYATTIAVRIKDAVRNGFYNRFDKHWAIILHNIITSEHEAHNPNNW